MILNLCIFDLHQIRFKEYLLCVMVEIYFICKGMAKCTQVAPLVHNTSLFILVFNQFLLYSFLWMQSERLAQERKVLNWEKLFSKMMVSTFTITNQSRF